MKTLPKTAIVALMTTAIGFSAVAPTFAQDAAPAAQADRRDNFRHHDQRPQRPGPMGGSDILGFERGAEAVEIAFVRLSHAIELTDEQQALFDTFRTEALAAAEDFATTAEGLRPAAPAEGETPVRPNIAERLENRIALDTARLDALKSVQPAAVAFFDSLTEEQLAELTPHRPGRDGMPGFGKGGPRHHDRQGGPMDMQNGPMETPAPAPEAPTNG